jgi:sigma-B regulation protein RsbU (phosphoserine phosphatase)
MQVREGSKQRIITPPAEVLAKLNHRFPMESSADQYFTMAYGILNVQSGELRYSSAGHPPIIHQRPGQSPQVLYATGFPIGWDTGVEYEERTLQLEAGDRIWMYSDGICEAMNSEDTTYGTDRLLKNLEAGRAFSLDDSVASLIKALETWAGETGQTDDVSVLGMEFGRPG